MLRNVILQDAFGMLSFLRLFGLRIDGRRLKSLRINLDTICCMFRIVEKMGKMQWFFDEKVVSPK
jgi:hypothetical protein